MFCDVSCAVAWSPFSHHAHECAYLPETLVGLVSQGYLRLKVTDCQLESATITIFLSISSSFPEDP